MNHVTIKKLVLDEVDIFFNLRLEALKNSPESFLFSYEEEKASGPTFYANILKQNSDDNVIFGAFVNDDLIGIVGLYRKMNSRLKHKTNLWGNYVLPEIRKLGVARKLMNAG